MRCSAFQQRYRLGEKDAFRVSASVVLRQACSDGSPLKDRFEGQSFVALFLRRLQRQPYEGFYDSYWPVKDICSVLSLDNI